MPVHLLRGDGTSRPLNQRREPAARCALQDGGATLHAVGSPFLEYLDETHRPLARRSGRRGCRVPLALNVACRHPPLNNLRVLRLATPWHRVPRRAHLGRLDTPLDGAGHRKPCEAQLRARQMACAAMATRPLWPDCCLVPQVFNARPLRPWTWRRTPRCSASRALRAVRRTWPGRAPARLRQTNDQRWRRPRTMPWTMKTCRVVGGQHAHLRQRRLHEAVGGQQ